MKRLLVEPALAWHDVGDYPRLGKRLYRNDGVWNLVDLANVMDPKAGAGSRVGSK